MFDQIPPNGDFGDMTPKSYPGPLVDFGCRSTGRSYASQRGRDPKASEVETAGQCH